MGSSHGRFVWYELMTTDVEAAKAFYGKVVGWGAREAPGSRYTLFMVGRAATGGLVDLPLDAKKEARGHSGSVISASTTWTAPLTA
jgi:predicted enzyme related to lactoylglutathione lyase